jgi:hypothetical protein
LEQFGHVAGQAVAEYVGRLPVAQQRALRQASEALCELFARTF